MVSILWIWSFDIFLILIASLFLSWSLLGSLKHPWVNLTPWLIFNFMSLFMLFKSLYTSITLVHIQTLFRRIWDLWYCFGIELEIGFLHWNFMFWLVLELNFLFFPSPKIFYPSPNLLFTTSLFLDSFLKVSKEFLVWVDLVFLGSGWVIYPFLVLFSWVLPFFFIHRLFVEVVWIL